MAGQGRWGGLMLVPTVAALAVFGLAAPAQAGTITVTTTADGPGGCSLREAVRSANLETDFGGCNDSDGDDRIRLHAETYLLTRDGPEDASAFNGDLDLFDDVEIVGTGPGATTVRGKGLGDRIFEVFGPGTTVRIAELAITHGRLPPSRFGGALENDEGDVVLERVAVRGNRSTAGGGGLSAHQGTLTVRNSSIAGNEATPSGSGGGIYFQGPGTLTVVDSAIAANEAAIVGGGIYANSTTMASLERSSVGRNRAENAGGIVMVGAGMTLTRSGVRRNRAEQSGGGLAAVSAGALTLSRTTVSRNRAGTDAGGIEVNSNNSSLTVLESTIANNEAVTGDGGGIRMVNGTHAFENATISGNRAGDDGGGFFTGTASLMTPEVSANNTTIARNVADADESGAGAGGGFYQLNGSIELDNSIVGENLDLGTVTGPDCAAGAITADYSLFGTTMGCTVAAGTNNLTAAPLLSPLDDRGGPTPTHGLPGTSPATDAANPNPPGSAPGTCAMEDQRGVTRPEGLNCDMGAFERRQP